MNKVKTMFFISIWVMALPYLGFPISLKNILLSITGLIMAYFSYLIYKDLIGEKKEKKFENFSENSFHDLKREEVQ